MSPSSTTGSGIEKHEAGPTGSSRDAGMALEWEAVKQAVVIKEIRVLL